jgi:hypothetical protein
MNADRGTRQMRRIAAGLLAGVLAALVGVAFWVIWGGDPATTADLLQADPDPDAPTATAPGATTDLRRVGALIGARERNVQSRLAATAPAPPRRLRSLDLRVRDLTWREPDGAVWARASAFNARLDLDAATRGDVVVTGATLTRPRIALRQDAAGNWNYEDVFAELLAAEPAPGPPRLFTVRGLQMVEAHVDVRMPERVFALEGVNAQLASLTFSDPQRRDPNLVLATATGTLYFPADGERLAVRLADGRVRFPTGTVLFDVADATVAGTRLAQLTGQFGGGLPGMGLRVAGRAFDVDLAELGFLLPETLPRTGLATFAFAVEPLTDVRTAIELSDLVYAADGSRVLGSLLIHVEPERFELRRADLRLDPLALALLEPFTGPLPYGGTLVGTITGTDGDIAFDLNARLVPPGAMAPFSIALAGRALVTPAGFALQRLEATFRNVAFAALRPVAPGLPLRGMVTGTVVLTGLPTESPLQLDVRLELAAGIVTLAGMVDITGAVPRYDVTGRLVGVNLQALLEPDVPPVTLTARFAAAGSGFDPATANANVSLDGRFTGWQTGPADTISLRAALRQGALDVGALTLRLATLETEAEGVWRFIDPIAGSVRYRLAVADLEPFGPYVPVLGDTIAAGSLQAQGAISGTLAQFELSGDAQGTGLVLGGWSAAAFEAEYAMAFSEEIPRIVFDATAVELVTPTAGTFRTALAAVRLTPPLFTVDIRGDRADGTGVQVFADGEVPPGGPAQIIVQRAQFDIDDQRWRLARPAVLAWEGLGGLVVTGFDLEDEAGPGRIRIDGRVLPLAAIDAQIELDALPLAEVQQLIGRDPVISGLLWSSARVVGPGTDPRIDATFRIENGVVQEVPITLFEGTASYADDLLRAAAVVSLADAGVLEFDGTVPMRITLSDPTAFELLDDGPLAGRLVADRLALAPFGVLSPFVTNVQGVVNGSFNLGGTVGSPQLAGRFEMVDGAITIPALDQRFVEAYADIELIGQQVIVHQVRARSDGWATLSGTITFPTLTTPVVDLTTQLDGFRALGAGNRRGAAAFGQTRVAGDALNPVMTGRLRFEDGTIVIPEFRTELDMGPEIGGTRVVFDDQLLFPAPVPPAWYDAIRIQGLQLSFAENVWFDAFDARVQLSGELTVDRAGDDLVILGTLEGTRGQYILVAGPIVRRFDVTSAQVRFLGTGELNPQIEFIARRRVIDPGGRHLEIDVRVGGTAQNPTLSLASQDAAMIPQSELLSFLLFGQPSFALGGGALPGEALLEQTFVGGIAELAGLELEQALVRDLGLPVDILQIHLGTGRFGGFGTPVLFLGRELTPNVWLTVETGLGALFADAEGGTQTWAIRLEWAIDGRTTLRGGFEPVQRNRLLRGMRFALPATRPQQQLSVELRRRWYY